MTHNYYYTETNILLFTICLFIACMVFIMRSIMKKNVKGTPQNILEQKLSKGEIDTYEYNQRKRQLQRDEDLKIKMFFLSRM